MRDGELTLRGIVRRGRRSTGEGGEREGEGGKIQTMRGTRLVVGRILSSRHEEQGRCTQEREVVRLTFRGEKTGAREATETELTKAMLRVKTGIGGEGGGEKVQSGKLLMKTMSTLRANENRWRGRSKSGRICCAQRKDLAEALWHRKTLRYARAAREHARKKSARYPRAHAQSLRLPLAHVAQRSLSAVASSCPVIINRWSMHTHSFRLRKN